MDIKNRTDLVIKATSNGVIVSELSGRDMYCPDLAVFNDPDEMAEWIKAFFLEEPPTGNANAYK